MCVRQALGIAGLVAEANLTWPEWTASEEAVGRFGSVERLEQWRDHAGHDEIENLFAALGRLTQDEVGSHRAVAVMVHLLAPGIGALTARRCRGDVASGEVEAVVAGYVWTTILDYRWEAPPDSWIPAAILRSVRRAVDREFGWGDRGDRAWRERMHLEPEEFGRMPSASKGDQALEASGLYWWAIRDGQVSASDLDVLLQLAVIATDEGITARSSAGITSRTACARLASERGLSVNQLQYRARKTLGTLRDSAGTRR